MAQEVDSLRGCWRALPLQQRQDLLEGLPEAAALAVDPGGGTATGSCSSSGGNADLVQDLVLAPVAWCFKVRCGAVQCGAVTEGGFYFLPHRERKSSSDFVFSARAWMIALCVRTTFRLFISTAVQYHVLRDPVCAPLLWGSSRCLSCVCSFISRDFMKHTRE